jgi:hypothetical protein
MDPVERTIDQPVEGNEAQPVNFEEQILSNLLAPEGVESVSVGPDTVIPQGFREEEAPVDVEAPKYNPVWDYMAQRAKTTGIEYEPPDFIKTRFKPDGTELTAEEEYDILLAEIASGVQPDDDDPFIAEYRQAKTQDNFDFKQWVQGKVSKEAVLEADDYTFMKQYMKEAYGQNDKRPNGMTDEQIEDSVKKMDNSGVLALQANQSRDQYRKLLEQADQVERDLRLSQQKERMTLVQANQQKLMEQLFQRKRDVKEVFGMQVSEAMKTEFEGFFKNIMQIDPQTGVPGLHKYLSNDDALFDAVFLMYMRDKGLRDMVNGAKEEVKKQYINRLDIAPKDMSQRSPITPMEVDPQKLMQPEGNY